MSMRIRAEEYLALRRALGHTMHGYDRMLLDFADRLDMRASAASPWQRCWSGRPNPRT